MEQDFDFIICPYCGSSKHTITRYISQEWYEDKGYTTFAVLCYDCGANFEYSVNYDIKLTGFTIYKNGEVVKSIDVPC